MARRGTVSGHEVIHVRDDFTGATFPVLAEPTRLEGFVLEDPPEGERSPRAVRTTVEVYLPIFPTLDLEDQRDSEEDSSEG